MGRQFGDAAMSLHPPVEPSAAQQGAIDLWRRAFWAAAITLVAATFYISWSAFTARALTVRYVCDALMIAMASAVAIRAEYAILFVATVFLSFLPLVLAP